MKQINVTDSQFEKIKASGILEEKEKEEEFVKDGQEYYSLDEYKHSRLIRRKGYFAEIIYQGCRACANVFLTEAEAIKANSKRLALGNIQKFMRENGIEVLRSLDWKDNTEKWQISGYDFRDGCDEVVTCWYYNLSNSPFNLIFSTQENCQKVTEACKQDIKVLYS